MSHPSRRVALAGAGALLLAVTACSSSTDKATPTPSADPVVEWAGTVCSSASELKSTVSSLTDTVKVDVQDKRSATDQLKSQASVKMGAVADSAAVLVKALENVPPSSSEAVDDAAASLKKKAGLASAAVDDVQLAADDLENSTTAKEVAASAPKLVVPLAAAAFASARLVTSLQQYATAADAELDAAFGAAPSCTALKASTAAKAE